MYSPRHFSTYFKHFCTNSYANCVNDNFSNKEVFDALVCCAAAKPNNPANNVYNRNCRKNQKTYPLADCNRL